MTGELFSVKLGARYDTDERRVQTRETITGWFKRLSNQQGVALKKDSRASIHEGAMMGIVDTINDVAYHSYAAPDDPLEDKVIYVPTLRGKNDETISQRRNDFYDELESLNLHKSDGAILVGRDGRVLASRIYFQAKGFDPEQIPAGGFARHMAAAAQSQLNEYPWIVVLSEERNDVHTYEDGTKKLIYTSGEAE